MDLELLEEIGLTKSEIKVFLALLEIGSSTTGPIVEKSGAASSKIYEVLEKLMQKGLVSFVIKASTKHFEAASPERLLDYMREKEARLKEQTTSLQKLLPELKLKRAMADASETTVFKGKKGAETAFKELLNLNKNDEVSVIGFSNVPEWFEKFLARFHRKRSEKGIRLRAMFGQQMASLGKKLSAMQHTEIKYYSRQTQIPVAILVYRDISLFSMPMDLLWIQIKNNRLADANRERFTAMWEQNTTVVKGKDAMLESLKRFVDYIKPGDSFDALGATYGPGGNKQEFADLFKKYHDYRRAKRVHARLLIQAGARKTFEKNKQIYANTDVKFLPYETAAPVSIHPYKDKTMMIIQEKEPTVITIRNKEITQAFKQHFEELWNQDVKVYKGFDAVTQRISSVIDECDDKGYYVLGATYGETEKEISSFFKKYHTIRIKKGVSAHLLCVHRDFQKIKERFHPIDSKQKYTHLRKLSPEFSSPMQIVYYNGNKVLMLLFGKEFVCFEIESEELFENFNAYFQTIWHQETTTFCGLDAVQDVFVEMLEAGHCDFIGARGYFMDHRRDWIEKEWIPRAKKTGFTMRNVVDPEVKGHFITTFPFSKTKYTLQKEFANLSVFWIYGEKVVISNWMSDEPIVFVMNNKQLHDLYKKQFTTLWNS